MYVCLKIYLGEKKNPKCLRMFGRDVAGAENSQMAIRFGHSLQQFLMMMMGLARAIYDLRVSFFSSFRLLSLVLEMIYWYFSLGLIYGWGFFFESLLFFFEENIQCTSIDVQYQKVCVHKITVEWKNFVCNADRSFYEEKTLFFLFAIRYSTLLDRVLIFGSGIISNDLNFTENFWLTHITIHQTNTLRYQVHDLIDT